MSDSAPVLSLVQQWAALYIERGFQVVPLESNTKNAFSTGWKNLTFRPDDFEPTHNIGLRHANNLCICDEDCPEAVAVADAFLPQTGAVYGRPSKPRSKRLYYSTFEKTVAFGDWQYAVDEKTGKQTLLRSTGSVIELRAGHQDMAPPSIHSCGELLSWDGDFAVPETVEAGVLLRAVRLTATCAIIARYYNPPGARHDFTLALSGTLKHFGVTQDECIAIITHAAKWANDAKLADRILEVRSTYERSEDDATIGLRALDELTGRTISPSLSKIWGAKSSGFILDAKGDRILTGNPENIRRAISKLQVGLAFNEFSHVPLVKYNGYSGQITDAVANGVWFDIDTKFHFLPNKQLYRDVFEDTAIRNPFHPVMDYLKPLMWDGVPRIDTWLIRSAHAADTDYVRAVSAIMLMAAVKRVTHPGCKYDEMVVLESPKQGLLKSTALRTLCPNEEWFSDDLPLNVDSQQLVERTLGKWIIESSDLSGMRPASVEHLKGMLSRQTDGPVRLAYAHFAMQRPRHFIVIGTTNSQRYLMDTTGNRRFWPVRVEVFDVELIRRERDQLWAEAVYREANGESIRLDPILWDHAAFQQERRREKDEWEDVLNHAFDGQDNISPGEIRTVLGFHTAGMVTPQHTRRINDVMTVLGWRRKTMRKKEINDGKPFEGWARNKGQEPLDLG